MVLVDALTEGLRDAETPEEWALPAASSSQGDMTETLKLYPEIERDMPTRASTSCSPPRRCAPMPLAVLSADQPWGPLVPGFIADGVLPPDTPPDVGYVTDRAAEGGARRARRRASRARGT